MNVNANANANTEEFVCECGHPLSEHTDLSDPVAPDASERWICNVKGCTCRCFSPVLPPLTLGRKEAKPSLERWL